MDRNGLEWTSITGTDLKIHPKLQVLSVLDKKFWISNSKYPKSSVSRQFLSYPDILVDLPYKAFLHQSPLSTNVCNKDHCIPFS